MVEYSENLSMDLTEIWHQFLRVILPQFWSCGRQK